MRTRYGIKDKKLGTYMTYNNVDMFKTYQQANRILKLMSHKNVVDFEIVKLDVKESQKDTLK